MSLLPICRPVSVCQPCQPPPCLSICIPPPPCYYPCLPPCSQVCQQPCTPYPSPCQPGPCCPPPPCCKPKPGCCGGGSGCCSGGPKSIVCVQRRAQIIFGGCGTVSGGRGGTKKTRAPVTKSGMNDQQASYNNCNFYLTEIPSALRDMFGGNDECTEEDATTVCTDETEGDTSVSRDDEEDNCEEDERFNQLEPWGQQMPQNPWGTCFPGYMNPCCFPFFPFGFGGQGMCGMGGDKGGMSHGMGGGGSGNGGGNRGGGPGNRDGGFENRDGGFGNRGGGPGNRDGGFENRGGGPGNRDGGFGNRGRAGRGIDGAQNGPTSGVGNAPRGRGDWTGGNGRFLANDPNSGTEGANNAAGRYTANDDCNRPSRQGMDPCRTYSKNFSAKRVRSKNSQISTSRGRYTPGATSRTLSKSAGFRPYHYSHEELTRKSQAYLPEKYDEQPPHVFDKRIHPSRAPISNYAKYNPADLEVNMAMMNVGNPMAYRPGNMIASPTSSTSNEYTAIMTKNNMRTLFGAYNSTHPNMPRRSMSQGLLNPSYPAIHPTQHVNFKAASSKSGLWAMQVKMNVPERARSEPNLLRPPVENDKELIPIYRTTTQTRMQIIERENQPSEIRIVQKPVQEVTGYQIKQQPETQNSRIKLDIVTEDLATNTRKRKKTACRDPCHPPRACLKPHARRLHRLCSFTNRRKRRLSQIHKPIFNMQPPRCPIRETLASILRKVPPARCNMHSQPVPPYHEYCMTNHCPDTNRYPLLTKDLPSHCVEDEANKNQVANQNDNEKNTQTRGAKRKQHHR